MNVEFSAHNELPNEGGIYGVFANGVPLYIGQTQRLRNRLMGHQKRELFLSHGADEIRVIICDDRWERENMETFLIRAHRPILNLFVPQRYFQSKASERVQ